MDFYEKFVRLCNKKGVTPSKAAVDAGATRTAASNWKVRGTKPTTANLIKIADYFDVPVSYFDDREEKEFALDLQLFSVQNTQEQSLIDIFRKLDEIDKAKLLVFASELAQDHRG